MPSQYQTKMWNYRFTVAWSSRKNTLKLLLFNCVVLIKTILEFFFLWPYTFRSLFSLWPSTLRLACFNPETWLGNSIIRYLTDLLIFTFRNSWRTTKRLRRSTGSGRRRWRSVRRPCRARPPLEWSGPPTNESPKASKTLCTSRPPSTWWRRVRVLQTRREHRDRLWFRWIRLLHSDNSF